MIMTAQNCIKFAKKCISPWNCAAGRLHGTSFSGLYFKHSELTLTVYGHVWCGTWYW